LSGIWIVSTPMKRIATGSAIAEERSLAERHRAHPLHRFAERRRVRHRSDLRRYERIVLLRFAGDPLALNCRTVARDKRSIGSSSLALHQAVQKLRKPSLRPHN
jgi:hypothetical protein